MDDTRADDAQKICDAYLDVLVALQEVGRLLRTTYAGKFMWSAEHKSAITGLKVLVEKLRQDVPTYDGKGP